MLLVQVHAVDICEEVSADFGCPTPANNLINASRVAPIIQQTKYDLNGTRMANKEPYFLKSRTEAEACYALTFVEVN